jgi:hypothetical protein
VYRSVCLEPKIELEQTTLNLSLGLLDLEQATLKLLQDLLGLAVTSLDYPLGLSVRVFNRRLDNSLGLPVGQHDGCDDRQGYGEQGR